MISGQLIARGQLTDPGVNFASVHCLTPVTVHMRFSFPRGNLERRATRCTTPGNPPSRGNFSPCEQNANVLRMLIINVWNKFPNKKFQKAPEIGKRHWKKLTCSTRCRKHGIIVGLAWNHENSILIPYCGSFKFHITYAETGYQLWN